MENVLHKLWDTEVKILDKIDEICTKHDIEYVLLWGTLLGAVRHKGFIPWDDDIDIGMSRKDYNKFLKVAKKELPGEFFLQTCYTDKYQPTYFAKVRLNNTAFYATGDTTFKRHHGIFVDIFPMDSRNGKRLQNIKNKIGDRISSHIIQRRCGQKVTVFKMLKIFPTSFLCRLRDSFLTGKGDLFSAGSVVRFKKTDVFPAIKIPFQGKEYSVPNNYDSVLKSSFGDYMQLPPEDQRVAHIPAFISFDLEKDKEKFDEYINSIK